MIITIIYNTTQHHKHNASKRETYGNRPYSILLTGNVIQIWEYNAGYKIQYNNSAGI